jgi:sugar/nucleoside kinase (ribokinase family)
MIDLCAVGDIHWLLVLSVPRIPLPGEMLLVKTVERLPGNDATIVSLQAASLGRACCLLATNAIALHDGRLLIEKLQRAGVDTSLIDTGAAFTPATFFLQHLSLDERVGLTEDSAFRRTLSPDQLPPCRFAYVDLYDEHFTERLALLQHWSQAGVRVLVNLSASHPEEKIAQLAALPAIDTVQMRGQGSVQEALRWGQRLQQQCRAQALLMTLGGVGMVLVEPHTSCFVAAEPVQPLRTIGAGASFSAGFLSALLGGSTYQEAALFASRHAATFCTSISNPLEVVRE